MLVNSQPGSVWLIVLDMRNGSANGEKAGGSATRERGTASRMLDQATGVPAATQTFRVSQEESTCVMTRSSTAS